MAAAVASARATYLDAARRRDLGRPYSAQASVAKLVATDAAMKVTTDAVQVFGGVGYTRDYRVERYMREAKITQIFEGTNQIQRLVIARGLTPSSSTTVVTRRLIQQASTTHPWRNCAALVRELPRPRRTSAVSLLARPRLPRRCFSQVLSGRCCSVRSHGYDASAVVRRHVHRQPRRPVSRACSVAPRPTRRVLFSAAIADVHDPLCR